MQFREMAMVILHSGQQKKKKKQKWKEQAFGLCGTGQWWDDLREEH